ncbi:GNAT family N-acetyltransferase [Bacillus sp. SM2101]|uniref:GNAT family N-acetyltransferase n=1 Tax=Bacillus sp. SM2101 TaxID=2805366 RepID=UPI0020330C4E|nr:GNAT family N-acetyltransferase [Bacillus sp. SM2101]
MDLAEMLGISLVHTESLKKESDVMYEVEVQKSIIESKGDKILKIIERKNDVLILFRALIDDTEKDDDDIILNIRSISKEGVFYPDSRLYAIPSTDCKILDLADIQVQKQYINKGYGSILLKTLKEIAIEKGVKEITGWISPADRDHVDRLKHFYEKHGFEVNLHKSRIVWRTDI